MRTKRDSPKVLYKYLKREHALRWLSRGEVRIGVLSDYRKTEQYGAEVGDADEGTRVLWDAPDVVDSERPETISDVVRQCVAIRPGIHVKLEGLQFSHHQVSLDYYVLCFSTGFSEEAMRRMNPAYDAYVRIDNPVAFLNAVTTELYGFRIVSKLVACHWCVYRDRVIHVSDEASDVPMPLLKDPRYAYQKELRAAWEPRRRDVRPIARNVYSLEAARFCSPYLNCG